MNKTNKIEEIKKEFMEKFSEINVEFIPERNGYVYPQTEILNYWLQKISQSRKELLGEITEEVRELKRPVFGDKYSSTQEDITYGFNLALDTVLKILSSKANDGEVNEK